MPVWGAFAFVLLLGIVDGGMRAHFKLPVEYAVQNNDKYGIMKHELAKFSCKTLVTEALCQKVEFKT